MRGKLKWTGLVVVAGSVLLRLATLETPTVRAFPEVRAAYQSSDARLLDRNGEIIHELRVDNKSRRLRWTPYDELSPALIDAVVTAEDKRFHSHRGVDWSGAIAAVWSSLTDDGARGGASTISMQLATQLDARLRAQDGRRTLTQKWAQMQAARALERSWSKAQILEAYVNLITYRGEIQGIAAASRGLFDKEPSGLTRDEAIVIATLIRGPNAAPALVAHRACALSRLMSAGAKDGASAHEETVPHERCESINALTMTATGSVPRVRGGVSMAPHLARLLLRAQSMEVRTTLDAGIQRHAHQALRHHLLQLGGKNVRDGAVLVVDNASGEVIAYVGNAGNNPRTVYVDGVKAMRQAGSTLKPFLYGLAIEQQRLTAASLLNDAPVNLLTPTGLYVPQNYDKEFRGWVSARTALASSLNVPAVRTLMLVGVNDFVERLRRLGFAGMTESGEYYGYSLALGSAEVSLWQLVNAYRTLANGGRATGLILTRDRGSTSIAVGPPFDEGDTDAMDVGAAFIVSDVLADRGARAATFGLDNPIALPFRAAVKTGTSKDMRDNWCIGYSSRYTVGVWVGNFDGEPMHEVSGVTGAAPIWAEVMRRLHQANSGPAPRIPAGVMAEYVRFEPAIEPARREYFLLGTQMPLVMPNPGRSRAPRITYPGTGMMLALDPDIPRDRQRVFFAMEPTVRNTSWYLDGMPFSASRGWAPESGHHLLQLFDAQGNELDQVRFTVRGHQLVSQSLKVP